MRLLGLTGGIATGKSTVASLFAEAGCAVVDTDQLARQAVEPGTPALAEILRAFGSGVIDEAGRLRRSELARRVFADPEVRQRLEAILHPPIRRLWQDQVERWRAAGCGIGMVVIPLLFETQAADEFDRVVCTACSEASQHERLAARGWTPSEAAARLEAQWPSEVKVVRSDLVVWTEGDLSVARSQVSRILRQLNLHPSLPSARLRPEKLVP